MALSLRWRNALVAIGAVVVLLVCFPPVRVVKIGGVTTAGPAFNPESVADRFWRGERLEVMRKAVDATALAAALAKDPASATRFGRHVGLGGTTYYCVAGEGRIVAVSAGAIQIAVGPGDQPAYTIDTGPVFGNAIRDGTGVFDVNAFTNSQDYNALAAALNRRVEQDVLPALRRQGRVGARVRFAGCIECDNDTAPLPLAVVPLLAEVR